MRTLTNAQRAHLRRLAHHLKPVVQIGQAGLTPPVLAAIDGALETHELVKVKVAGDEVAARDLIPAIESGTRSAVVQVIGHVLVVYRRRPKEPRISLPAAGAAADDDDEDEG